jgi:hypothetical protein
VDLEIPTVTLELPQTLTTRAEYDKWIEAEAAALKWVGGLEADEEVRLSSVVQASASQQQYEAIELGLVEGSALVAERLGGEGSPVLVVAGLDGSDMSLLVAERFRASLLGKLQREGSQRRVLLLLAAAVEEGAAGVALIEQLAAKHGAAAVVEITTTSDEKILAETGSGGDDMLAALQGALVGQHEVSTEASGRLADWAADSGLPVLMIAVPEEPADMMGFRAFDLVNGLNAVVAAAPK